MKTMLQLALAAAGAWFLLPKLGVALPGTETTPPVEQTPPAEETPPAEQTPPAIAAQAIFAAQVQARAAQNGQSTYTWWEWTWFYHNVLNGNAADVIPPAESYGVPNPGGQFTFTEFWSILQDSKARGIGADVAGLAGVRRR